MKSVKFVNGTLQMAGNLHVPADFDGTKQYPAIVCVHPGGGVKEQTAGGYAKELARRASSRWPSTRRTRAKAEVSRAFSKTPMPAWVTCAAPSII